jgi:fatty-acyl-CoA synthase
VEVPRSDGKAGMAAITLQGSGNFDLIKFSDFLNSSLPRYAIPVFVRICNNLEVTGTFKLRKVNLKKEGYNPNNFSDPLYIWDSKSKCLKKFIPDIYQAIDNGDLRL